MPELPPEREAGRSIRRQFWPLLTMGLGIILIVAGIGWLLLGQIFIGAGDITLPDRLGGEVRSEQLTGQAALREIERLHGKGFTMTDGAVAYYGQGTATVWVSSTWLPLMAARQVQAMTDRIAEGKSPFKPAGTLEIDGITVYALTGMGQQHYYFQLGRRVVWLAAVPRSAEQSLQELIQQLR